MIDLPPASPIIPGVLFQGNIYGYMAFRPDVPGLHVACPADYPPDPESAREVIFFPLEDDSSVQWIMNELWCGQVMKVAQIVAGAVGDNQTTVVSCAAGLNRSGLITGLALCAMGWTPNEAIDHIRECRPGALFNMEFVRAIRWLGPKIMPPVYPVSRGPGRG